MSRELGVSTSPSGDPAYPNSSQSYTFPRTTSQTSPTGGHDSGVSCDASLSSSPIPGRPFSPAHANTRKRYPFLLCHSPSLPSIQSSSSLAELEAGSSDSEITDDRVRVQSSDILHASQQQNDGMTVQERRISFPPHTSQHYRHHYQQDESERREEQSAGTRGDGASVLHQRMNPMLLIPGTKAVVKVSHNNRVLKRNFADSGIARRLSNLFPAEAERLTRSQSNLVLNLSKNPSGSMEATQRSVMDRVRILETSSNNNKLLSRSQSDDQSGSGNGSRYGNHFPVPVKSISVTGKDCQSLPLFSKLCGRDVSRATVGPDCYVNPESITCRLRKRGSRRYEQQVKQQHQVDGISERASSSLLLNAAAKSRRLILPRIFMIEKALKNKPDRFLLSSASRSQPRRGPDPVTELEELVRQLGLDDEDLLDRAERRDLPTRLQLLRSCTSHESDVKAKPAGAGDDSESFLKRERLKTPDLIRAPRAPPIRRSAIPDLIHDDVAFRKLRSKSRKRANDAKSLASCSPSYLLCSPVFTPCDSPPATSRFACLEPQPDVDLDDVSFRKITQSEGAKVSQPDPPFGIPKRVLLHSASCDYLNVIVDQEDKKNGFYRRKPSKRADRVKDDMAFRTWRRDLDHDDNEENDRQSPLLPVTTHNVRLMNARQRLRPSKSYSSLFYPSPPFHTSSNNSIHTSPLIPPPLDLDRKRCSSSLFHPRESRFSNHSITDSASGSPSSSMAASASTFNTMTGCYRSFIDVMDADHDRFHLHSDASVSLSSPNLPQNSPLQHNYNQAGTTLSERGSHENWIRVTRNEQRASDCPAVIRGAVNGKGREGRSGTNPNAGDNSRMQEMFSVIITDMRKREIFGRRDSGGECEPRIRRESLL